MDNETFTIHVECLECNFSANIVHEMDSEKFIVNFCPICGEEDIETEE